MNFIPPSFDFKGDRKTAISLKGPALSFYNHVSRQAEREGLPFIKRSQALPDGSIISIFSKKESSYNNRVGKITIVSPYTAVSTIPTSGSSVYITIGSTITSTPTSAIFSFASVNPITLSTIDTTGVFKNRFNQPYVSLTPVIFNAPEYTDPSAGLPPVNRICNSIQYTSTGEPIVYTGLLNPQIVPTLVRGTSQVSYRNIRYVGSDSKDIVVFDVFADDTKLYVLTGNNDEHDRYGKLNCFIIDTTKGRIGVNNRYTDVGYYLFTLTPFSNRYTLNYTADGGYQTSDYTNTSPSYNSRIIDAKFSPEFLNNGEITILCKSKKVWYENAHIVYEFTLNIVKDVDRGDPIIDYLFPDNVVKTEHTADLPFNWEEVTCPYFKKDKARQVSSETVTWFNIMGYQTSRTLSYVSGTPTSASPQFFARFNAGKQIIDERQNIFYFSDDVADAMCIQVQYSTGPDPENGELTYTVPQKVLVGETFTATAYAYYSSYEGYVYRDFTINNITSTLVGDVLHVEWDVTVQITPTASTTWHEAVLTQGYKPSAYYYSLEYQTIRKLWIDEDQSYICGFYYITDKLSPEYATKSYLFFGIKKDEAKPIEITYDYKYNEDVTYSLINTHYAHSPTEFATRFPEFSGHFVNPKAEIITKPTKFGNLTRGIYAGKTFADSVRLADFTRSNSLAMIEEGKTWKTTERHEHDWLPVNQPWQDINYPIKFKQLYGYTLVRSYQLIESTSIDSIDWDKETYTSKRNYDSVVQDYINQDICSLYPEQDIGIGSQFQWYTSHTPYSIQVPPSSTYSTSTAAYPPPLYFGSEYLSKLVSQPYEYNNGIKRIVKARTLNEVPAKKSTPIRRPAGSSPDYNSVTQASLTRAKEKSNINDLDRSFPGHAILFRISPDNMFYNINPSFRTMSNDVKGGNTYLIEDLSQNEVVDITTLTTLTGSVNVSTLADNAYPCGYSY